MGRPVGYGRPGTRVIPEGWAATHRPVVTATFTAQISIREPGGTEGPFDDETGTRPFVPHAPHHIGGARIQAQTTAGDEQAAGQSAAVAGYLVVVDRDSSAITRPGDLIEVTGVDDNGDPALVGRTLAVTSVTLGSLTWERDLYAEVDLDTPPA